MTANYQTLEAALDRAWHGRTTGREYKGVLNVLSGVFRWFYPEPRTRSVTNNVAKKARRLVQAFELDAISADEEDFCLQTQAVPVATEAETGGVPAAAGAPFVVGEILVGETTTDGSVEPTLVGAVGHSSDGRAPCSTPRGVDCGVGTKGPKWERSRLVRQAAAHVRAKVGLMKRTSANAMVARKLVCEFLDELKDLRKSHHVAIVPYAVELAFVPTVYDLEARDMAGCEEWAWRREQHDADREVVRGGWWFGWFGRKITTKPPVA